MVNAPNISMIRNDGKEIPMTLSAKACEWSRDNDGCYYVRCNDFRVIMPRQRDTDNNRDHNFAFCPYCGGRLTITHQKP